MNSCALSKLQSLINNTANQKIAVSAAGLAAVGSTARGEIIEVNSPVVWGNDHSVSVDWDINQDSTPDWTFYDDLPGDSSVSCFHSSGSGGFLKTGDLISSVTEETTINSSGSFATFGGGGCECDTDLFESDCPGIGTDALSLFTESPTGTFNGYFGFSFDAVSGTHYGIASFTAAGWDGDGNVDGTFTINSWKYESVANTPFSTVPEPSSAAVGLGVLALGATALRRRRRAVNA